MRKLTQTSKLLLATALLGMLSACGIKGDLTRPTEPVFGGAQKVRPISNDETDISDDDALPGEELFDDTLFEQTDDES